LKTFDFLVDQLPIGYIYNFDNYLFNKIKHINTQGVDERADYFIVNNVKKRIEGKIHFLIKDNIAYSPYRSLFGSFEFNPRIHRNLLTEFWSFIQDDLIIRGITKSYITNPADCYAPQKAEIVYKTLQNHGFTIRRKAVNHHIVINEKPLKDIMHPMEIRRLNKCKAQGFTFAAEPIQHAEEIYDYLSLCRKEQGLSVSISKRMFFRYMDEFPQSYPLFTVRDHKEIMAATVAIKVHRKILYNFLPGSKRKRKCQMMIFKS